MSEDSSTVSEAGDKRAARLAPLPERNVRRRVWAFIVGISSYNPEAKLNLEFASQDAQDLYNCLRLPEYGELPQDQIRILCDHDATLGSVVSELRKFLKLPGEEDIVILFFSCHGAIDRVNADREVPYLLPYDVKREDLAGTALPMREIHASIKDYLAAKRVIILADACYSGGIITTAQGIKSSANKQEDEASQQRYMQEINKLYETGQSRTRPGIAMFSSSQDKEVSKELASLKNGVFTHFLLRGLRGEADGETSRPDSVVTIGELFAYVTRMVMQKTENKQRPKSDMGSLDENLPLAIVGGIVARSRLALANALFALAQKRADPMRFFAAARQYDLAQKKGHYDSRLCEEAELGRVKSLALTRWARVEKDLMQPTSGRSTVAGEAELYKAHWLLCQERLAEAAAVLERFTQTQTTHPLAGLVRRGLPELAEQAAYQPRGHALLIGVSNLPGLGSAIHPLRGPYNDVVLLREGLVHSGRFRPEDITVLCDESATAESVREQLRRMSGRVQFRDVVFIHFSGQEPLVDAERQGWLLTYDAAWQEASRQPTAGLRLADVHDLLTAIPCATKILSLDVCNRSLSDFIRPHVAAADYQLWLSASQGETAVELAAPDGGESAASGASVATEGTDRKVYGLYSYVLARQLQQQPFDSATLDSFWDSVTQRVTEKNHRQRPSRMVGLLRTRPRQTGLAALLTLALQQQYASFDAGKLEGLRQTLLADAADVPDAVFVSLTMALVEHRMWQSAASLLDRCACASEAERAFMVTQALAANELDFALQALRAFSEQSLDRDFECLRQILSRLNERPRTALILSEQRTDPARTPDRTLACSWTHTIARHLRGQFLYRCAVLEETDVSLRPLGQASQVATGPLTIVVLGNGRRSGSFGLFTEDGRALLRLSGLFRALADVTQPAMVLIDRGVLGLDPQHRGLVRSSDLDIRDMKQLTQLLEDQKPKAWVVAVDASALSEVLAGHDGDQLTFEVLREHPRFQVLWPPKDSPEAARCGPILDGDDLLHELLKRLGALQAQTARDIKQSAGPATGHDERDPDLQLNLAVADLELGLYDTAQAALKRIVALSPSAVDPAVRAEASFLLGRLLSESGDNLDLAVSCFKDARDAFREWAQAHYFLAQALRAQAERRIQRDVADAYRKYLSYGAPIGFENEVRAFLIEQSFKTSDARTQTDPLGGSFR